MVTTPAARRPLTAAELEIALATLPGWSVVTTASPVAGEPPATELHRRYKLADFDAALAFMLAAAPFINATDHHPRWENVYATVKVWLATHDAGNQITQLDVNLARHLESIVRPG